MSLFISILPPHNTASVESIESASQPIGVYGAQANVLLVEDFWFAILEFEGEQRPYGLLLFIGIAIPGTQNVWPTTSIEVAAGEDVSKRHLDGFVAAKGTLQNSCNKANRGRENRGNVGPRKMSYSHGRAGSTSSLPSRRNEMIYVGMEKVAALASSWVCAMLS